MQHLSCGHVVKNSDSAIYLCYGEWRCDSDGDHKVLVHASVCSACAALHAQSDKIFSDEDQAAHWVCE